jgi:hypothetical protein
VGKVLRFEDFQRAKELREMQDDLYEVVQEMWDEQYKKEFAAKEVVNDR